MNCKNHPNREAKQVCISCGIPICDDCAEEVKPGEFYCFQCAMIQSVSQVGTSLTDKRQRTEEKKRKSRKLKWGPFHYFVILSTVLILVMWGVIFFGGKQAPGKAIDFTNNPRVFLFMVDSCIKRYAHFEGNRYPDKIADIMPKYFSLKEDRLILLKKLSYRKDPEAGYFLSFADPKPERMNIILSPGGIKYISVDTSEGN